MVTIQWFPGHMAKTKRQVMEKLKLIDVVFELVDARIPYSSSNPMIDDIVGSKPRVLLLNKADMADPEVTGQWQEYLREEGIVGLALNSQTGEGVADLAPAAKRLMHEKHEKMRTRGIKPHAIRAAILGIPNVGKSTLINRAAGKKVAKIGDRPGITKQQVWIKIKGELELLDTPGILWPKFEDQTIGFRLAATGAIKDEILEIQEIALFVLHFLKEHYSDHLQKRYKLENIPDEDIELFDEIGRKRGCLAKGGEIDYDKAAKLILYDLRTGRIGRISLETPDNV